MNVSVGDSDFYCSFDIIFLPPYIRESLNKSRLTAWHVICLLFFRYYAIYSALERETDPTTAGKMAKKI